MRNARGRIGLTDRTPSPVDSPLSVNRTLALIVGSLVGFGRTVSPSNASRSASDASTGGAAPAQNFALIMSPYCLAHTAAHCCAPVGSPLSGSPSTGAPAASGPGSPPVEWSLPHARSEEQTPELHS